MAAKRYVISFPKATVDRPILSELIKKFGLIFNILKASIDESGGVLTFDLIGTDSDIKTGVEFLKKLGVGVKPLSQKIRYDEKKCTQCGACVTFCPTSALHLDKTTREIKFDSSKCVLCAVCTKYCPPRALDIVEG